MTTVDKTTSPRGGRATSETENLAGLQAAAESLLESVDRSGRAWAVPRAPGKWSPSQVVEHLARVLEESANGVAGAPTKFPVLPAVLRPVLRSLVLKRTVRRGVFPRGGKAFQFSNPDTGPQTPAAGRARLEEAVRQFDHACRVHSVTGGPVMTTTFGAVQVADLVKFQELHVRHHHEQIRSSPPVS